MKSSLVVLLVATACGPTFSENLFGGEQDAAAILEDQASDADVVAVSVLDAVASPETSSGEGSTSQRDGDDGVETSDGNVALSLEAGVDACDCTTLCNGGYPLRACESCIEVCPTYDGAVPW